MNESTKLPPRAASPEGGETPEQIAGRSKRVVDSLNALAGSGLSVGDAVPHPEGMVDFSGWLDLRVKKAARGRVELRMRTRGEMSNPTGLLHGGVQAAVMDSVIGITCATLGYKGFPITINLSCSFLGKLKIGEEVLAEGEVRREGAQVIHAHAALLRADGGVIAEAEANLLKTTFIPYYVDLAEGGKQRNDGKE